jgi:heme-degrading monooxygenase HmoA
VAIVIANNMTGGTQEIYEAVTAKVMPGDALPAGCQVHIAGPVNDGWRVITVWDSEEAFNRFREETLIPAIREVGGDVAPNIEASPVHKLVIA